MGQSKFRWIIVYGDGEYKYFIGTWEELLSWGMPGPEPIAIIRGDLM